MNLNRDLPLVAPRLIPVLDPAFRPAILANQRFQEEVRASGSPVPVHWAIEQTDGSVFHHATAVLPESHPLAKANFSYLERQLKFLLWSRGGFRVHFRGPRGLAGALQSYYRDTPTGRFDAHIMGDRIYERPFEVVLATELPPACARTTALGRHLDGCRIGFDLGGSDRKVAAVRDGQCVFSEETVWDPVRQTDPQYHYEGIMDSLKRAAVHLPRVDAIGGSAAGVYVNNRVKVASLFRGLSPELFESRAKNLFLELRRAWGDTPFEVVNDGEVTALAGSMALGDSAVLGTALGTSQAGGYVTPEGNITSWLNELAFVPVDYSPAAPVDEWSGDRGCGALYFSQQCVGRLTEVAGIDLDPTLGLPERLKHVQALMDQGDNRARNIYATIGTYLGYAVAHYADFYDFRHVLILGRVTSGPGGDVILDGARKVLAVEFPALSARVTFHTPDEKEKRHGQAMAAASLPQMATALASPD
jgi:predicted NBD/HSP70 family sugar kinase